MFTSLLERNIGTRNVGDPALIAGFWSEVGRLGTMRRTAFRQCDLEPDKDEGSDMHKKIVTGDTVGDPNNGHIWPCLFSMKH